VVFVGGATVSLYADRKIYEVRPTDDVDVILEILNYRERAELECQLLRIGFSNDVEAGIVCRYRIQGIVVDIMPTNDTSIGFSNIWYTPGFGAAINFEIDEFCTVKILPAPYFIATKLEAYKGRGKNDGRTSHDFEDIVFLLENRSSIWEEMELTHPDLREYLRSEFSKFLKSPYFFEWLDCHVERSSPPASYVIYDRLKKFAETPS
jgi:hypothetical protein